MALVILQCLLYLELTITNDFNNHQKGPKMALQLHETKMKRQSPRKQKGMGFWAWCRKCNEKIIEKYDTYHMSVNKYSFCLCKSCYQTVELQFIEENIGSSTSEVVHFLSEKLQVVSESVEQDDPQSILMKRVMAAFKEFGENLKALE